MTVTLYTSFAVFSTKVASVNFPLRIDNNLPNTIKLRVPKLFRPTFYDNHFLRHHQCSKWSLFRFVIYMLAVAIDTVSPRCLKIKAIVTSI